MYDTILEDDVCATRDVFLSGLLATRHRWSVRRDALSIPAHQRVLMTIPFYTDQDMYHIITIVRENERARYYHFT